MCNVFIKTSTKTLNQTSCVKKKKKKHEKKNNTKGLRTKMLRWTVNFLRFVTLNHCRLVVQFTDEWKTICRALKMWVALFGVRCSRRALTPLSVKEALDIFDRPLYPSRFQESWRCEPYSGSSPIFAKAPLSGSQILVQVKAIIFDGTPFWRIWNWYSEIVCPEAIVSDRESSTDFGLHHKGHNFKEWSAGNASSRWPIEVCA